MSNLSKAEAKHAVWALAAMQDNTQDPDEFCREELGYRFEAVPAIGVKGDVICGTGSRTEMQAMFTDLHYRLFDQLFDMASEEYGTGGALHKTTQAAQRAYNKILAAHRDVGYPATR